MSASVAALLALLAVNVGGLLAAIRSQARAWEWITKLLASSVCIALALEGGAGGSPYGRAVLVALALSWIGDALLIPASLVAFRAGILAFLGAHLAYIAAFFIAGVEVKAMAFAALASLVPLLLVARWIVPNVDARLKASVVAYMIIISAMVASAVGASVGGGIAWWIAPALLFYASDLLVARHRFVKPEFLNRALGLPLYYGAQALFALSVARP